MAKVMLDESMEPGVVNMLLRALGFVEEMHESKVTVNRQNGRLCRSTTETWTYATATTVICLKSYCFEADDNRLDGEYSAEIWENPTGKVMA